MATCWICGKKFSSKTELNIHLTSREHRRMTVICVWCSDEHTLTRPADLYHHCKQKHLIETNSLPRSFFSTGNCFYFSIYPADYVKIANIENWSSSNAIEARRLLMKWVEKQPGATVKKNNWRSGWKYAKEQDDSEILFTASEIENNQSKTVSKPSETENKQSKLKDKQSKTENKRSEIENRQSKTVNKPRKTENKQSETKDKQRKNEGKQSGLENKQSKKEEKTEGKNESMTVEVPTESTESKFIENQKFDTEKQKITESSDFEKISINETGDASSLLEDKTILSTTQSGGETPLFDENRDINFELELVSSMLGKRKHESNATENKQTKLIKDIHGYRRKVIPKDNTKEHETTQVDANNNNIKDKDMTQNTFNERAKDLLITGAMPFCPPGRRNWNVPNVFTVFVNGYRLSWPPTNWQKMTPDRKLLAWEHAAMSLEEACEAVTYSTSRAYLLDKYNFLALPESAKHRKEESEIASSRARFYVYQVLREVATGRQPSKAEELQILSLEKQRNFTDDFLFKLRSIPVPLRLEL